MAIIGNVEGTPLGDLLSGVFHQDWDLEYESPEDAIDYFCRVYPADAIATALHEVRVILGRDLTEQGMKAVLAGYLANYDPTHDGHTIREWLSQLADRLELAVEQRSGPS